MQTLKNNKDINVREGEKDKIRDLIIFYSIQVKLLNNPISKFNINLLL